MEARKNAFDDDEENVKPKKGLKINNANSSVPDPPPKVQNFRDNINEILNEEEKQKKLAFDIAHRFMMVLKDKTLDANKNVVVRQGEKQSIMDLIDFARLINSDENQEDNIGTMSIISTLIKAVLIQRDRINEIEYKLSKTESEVSSMSRKLAEKNKNSTTE